MPKARNFAQSAVEFEKVLGKYQSHQLPGDRLIETETQERYPKSIRMKSHEWRTEGIHSRRICLTCLGFESRTQTTQSTKYPTILWGMALIEIRKIMIQSRFIWDNSSFRMGKDTVGFLAASESEQYRVVE
jgi:hypothetical protein